MSSQENVLLDFNDLDKEKTVKKASEKKADKSKNYLADMTVSPELSPYQDAFCPPDIYDLLLPDGSKFGLFADPYSTMTYVDVNLGSRNGRYWLEQRLEDHTFTEREIKLLEFLAEHRVATRNQIHKVVFPEVKKKSNVIDMLQKWRQRGMICAFSWVSPLDTKDSPKKPLVYGLTRVGAEAVEILFHTQLHDDFWFHPIKFPKGKGPKMTSFYLDLVANELYSELERIDRCISWNRRPQIRLSDGTNHYPAASFEAIKDAGEVRTFWVETVRTGKDWVSRVKNRFKRTQAAFEKLSPYQRPARLLVIADGDARIPALAQLAEEYMPDVQCRFTNDERLLNGLNKETFIAWNKEKEEMKLSSIPFLQEGFDGMTATEYFAEQQLNLEDEDDLEYEE